MSNYADIKNGKVVNVCVASPEVAAERGWVACHKFVQIGMTYNKTTKKFSKPPLYEGREKQRDPVAKAKQKSRRDMHDLPDATPVTIGQLKSLGLLGTVGEAEWQQLQVQKLIQLRAAGLDDEDLRKLGMIE